MKHRSTRTSVVVVQRGRGRIEIVGHVAILTSAVVMIALAVIFRLL